MLDNIVANDSVLDGFLFMAFQGDSIYWVEVEKVVPNPFQPRREFDQGKLQELADSIRMYGVLQPLTVTRNEVQRDDGTFYTEYELIAGERRLRASKLAGTAQVPVIIREGEQNEQEKLELAIIENLQREDLNAVDRAIAFKQLAEMFEMSHAQVAKKMGRSREYVSNSIRLLGLPDHMLESLKNTEMMEGHARTLLMLTDRPEEQQVVYKEVLLKKLSVREVERIVRKIATDKVRKKNPGEFDANLIELEKQFTETLGTRVQIMKTDFGGKLTIDYFSEADLSVILKRIKEEENLSMSDNQETVDKLNQHTALVVENAVEPVEPVVKDLPQDSVQTEKLPEDEHSIMDYHDITQEFIETEEKENVVIHDTIPQTESPILVDTPEIPKAIETQKKEEEDDSSLYSINSFTV
jgi:ParB family chromosome partitioning protein